MFAAHEAQARIEHWQRTLPPEVAAPGREQPVTRPDLIGVILWELAPFICYGPAFRRPVADNLTRALDMFRLGRGEEFAYWIGESVDAAAKACGVEPFDPAAYTVHTSPWIVSYTAGDNSEAVLSVQHSVPGVGVLNHPVHHGRRFPTVEAARMYAWRFGLVKRFVSRFAAAQP